MVGDGTWLSVAEAVARLREAGYDDSPQTVRRLMAAGILRGRLTELGRHRRIEPKSVDELIERRTGDGPGRDAEAGVANEAGAEPDDGEELAQ